MDTNKRPRKYWTYENTINTLKQFIEDNNFFKQNSSISIIEKLDMPLVRAIYKFGGLRKLNEELSLGLTIKHRPWSIDDVLTELNMLHQKGIAITQKNLVALGRQDILGAVSRFGYLNNCKEILNIPINRQKYWSDKKVISELKPIVENYGRIPSREIFKYIGRNDLGRAVQKRGIKEVAGLMNCVSTGYYLTNDGDYVQSGYECVFDNILNKYGIPHRVHVKISEHCNYRSDFLIYDIHVEICGYNEKEHDKYWGRLQKKIELYKELQLSYLLIPKKIFNTNSAKVESKVLEYLRKIHCVDKRSFNSPINEQDIKPVSYWSDINNIKKELFPLVEKYGRMPFDKELRM
jgi:hypothetical protein